MELIQRLPFVLSISMAIIIGVLSKVFECSNQEVYTRMLLVMVAFFIIGLLIRQVVLSIWEELDDKIKEENIQKKKEALKQEQSEQDSNNKNNNEHSILNLMADEKMEDVLYDNEFSPLKVSEVIRNNARLN